MTADTPRQPVASAADLIPFPGQEPAERRAELVALHEAKVVRVADLTRKFLLVQSLCHCAAQGHG